MATALGSAGYGMTVEVSRWGQIENKILSGSQSQSIRRIIYVVIKITNFMVCGHIWERDNNPGVAIQRMKESYLDEGNKQGYEFSSLLACNSNLESFRASQW